MSKVALSAVLNQKPEGKLVLTAYASRTLSDSDSQFAVHEPKYMAMVFCCERFRTVSDTRHSSSKLMSGFVLVVSHVKQVFRM
jgi:hypothetical protein